MESDIETANEEQAKDDKDVEAIAKRLKQCLNGVFIPSTRGVGEGRFHCTKCKFSDERRAQFIQHLKGCRNNWSQKYIRPPNVKDVLQLSFCPECNEHFSNPLDAEDCLIKHGLSRCYSCFRTVPVNEIGNHYKIAHGIKSKYGLVSKCRWCNIGVAICKNALLLRRHAKGFHLDRLDKNKVGGRRRKSTNDVVQITRTTSASARTRPGSPPSTSQQRPHLELVHETKQDASDKNVAPISKTVGKGCHPHPLSGTLIPFLVSKYKENLAAKFSPATSKNITRFTSSPKYSTFVSDNGSLPPPLPPKIRKMDSTGKPIPLARRSKGPPKHKKPERRTLKPGMVFQTKPFSYALCPDTNKILDLNFNKVPKTYVHLTSCLNPIF